MMYNANMVGSMAMALLLFMVIFGGVSYILGKKRTDNPKIVALIGFFLGLMPLLGLFYVGMLLLKEKKY
ncbi:hypothetical protein [uncultured Shewanella sp.]|uniref:hypothetical protein n=1 Tax=uncultured Shewanella sp. TaxID=173975 RepID=UPI0026071AC9|nr:hypothetical protein [uncultured Shewanella sp.]